MANVIHEITPPAFEELLSQARSKLKDDGQMYIIDMEPLLYAEHYAVPYTYTEVEDLLNSNGWICNHDITPHRFVTMYIVTAEKTEGAIGGYHIDELWQKKRRNALAVYRTSKGSTMADYQKTMQAMTTVCSIESYLNGMWR